MKQAEVQDFRAERVHQERCLLCNGCANECAFVMQAAPAEQPIQAVPEPKTDPSGKFLYATKASPATLSQDSHGKLLHGKSVCPVLHGVLDFCHCGKCCACCTRNMMCNKYLLVRLQEDAKLAFKQLLASVGMRSDWSWEQAMRLIVSDGRCCLHLHAAKSEPSSHDRAQKGNVHQILFITQGMHVALAGMGRSSH